MMAEDGGQSMSSKWWCSQCSQPSGAPGQDGTAKCSPSSSLNCQDSGY